MKVIIDYFKNNMGYTITFLVSILVCVIAILAIVFIRKKREKILALKESENAEPQEEAKTVSIFDNLPESFKNAENQEVASPVLYNNEPPKDDDEITATQEACVNSVEKTEIIVEEKPQSVKTSPAPKKQEPSNKPVVEERVEEVKYAGKWLIYKENDRFVADLKASNGEIMLSSESYTSLSGIKSGIETLKKNIANENYAINLDKNGNYVFKIFSTANRLLCIGEGYSSKDQCEKAFASVKRFAKTAVIVNSLEKENNDK